MAEKIKRWIRGFRISYPRSVFDMSPVNLDHFEETEDAVSICNDWLNVCSSVRSASWRVYVG